MQDGWPRVTAVRAVNPKSTIDLLTPDDRSWEDVLAPFRRDVFHTAAYHAYAEQRHEGTAYMITVRDGDRGLAWPYLLRPIQEERLDVSDLMDVTSVYGYPGPISWGCAYDDPFIEGAWRGIVDIWRDQRVVAAFTRFHPLIDNAELGKSLAWPRGDRSGFGGVASVGPTVSIDLTKDMTAIRADYGRDLRRRIAKARRKGLMTVDDTEWRHLGEFIRLYHATMERAGADAFYFFSEQDFARLRSALPEELHLLAVQDGDRVVAAGLFTEFDGIVEWLLAASDVEYSHLSPSKNLLDDAIEWARDRGDRILHIGGGRGGREDSLYWFKSQFSKHRHRYHTGAWVLDDADYRKLVEARTAALEDGERLVPVHFPAYRAPAVAVGEPNHGGQGNATVSTPRVA